MHYVCMCVYYMCIYYVLSMCVCMYTLYLSVYVCILSMCVYYVLSMYVLYMRTRELSCRNKRSTQDYLELMCLTVYHLLS